MVVSRPWMTGKRPLPDIDAGNKASRPLFRLAAHLVQMERITSEIEGIHLLLLPLQPVNQLHPMDAFVQKHDHFPQ